MLPRVLEALGPLVLVMIATQLLSCATPGFVPGDREGRTAMVDGIPVHYDNYGRGAEAIVFVHGWSCDTSSWQFQPPELRAHARLLVVDLPGHGQSGKPDVKYTLDLFARSLEAVMDHAGVDRAVVVGHSNGGPVVLKFYRLFPEKTRGLVVVDGTLRPWVEDPDRFEEWVAPFRGEDYQEHADRFISPMLSGSLPVEVRNDLRDAVLSTPQHVMIGALEASGDPAAYSDAPIEVPLLMALARAPYWTDEFESFVRNLCPEVDYRMIDDVGHFVMVEKPDEFNAMLLEFLAGLPSGEGS